MNSSFESADAEERHTTQYFEMLGNRAIFHKGWTAVAKHKDPWLGSSHGLDDDVWELYNVEEDWTQSNDLAAAEPAKLGEGRVSRTLPFFFSMDETVDVGADAASPVSADYGASGNAFTGSISWVRIDVGDDSHDHLIDPEHQMQIAMTRQ